jgi:peptidoglycan/xylan/chitin deacetylase (PgdA/CDA1 family)
LLTGALLLLMGGVQPRAQTPAPALPAALKSSLAPTSATVTVDPYAAYVGKKFSHGLRSARKIALTFDDGPNPKTTPQVLEILRQADAKATFFMIGEMVDHFPETAKLVADAGMEIGTHSQTHANPVKLDEAGVRREIEDAMTRIQQATGKKPRLFRPPYGNINRTVSKVCAENGLIMCLWWLDPRDWENGATPAKVTSVVLSQAQGGDIVCMHDIKPKTVEALPAIVKGLKAAGFELVTVGTLLADEAAAPPEAKVRNGATGVAEPIAPSPPPALSLKDSSQY